MSLLREMFEEGMLDITVLLPERYFDEDGRLRDDLQDGYADEELHILHMNETTGIGIPGFRFDRRLGDANLEWEHVQTADYHHPSVLAHLEAEQ